jgi:hypothetical protein
MLQWSDSVDPATPADLLGELQCELWIGDAAEIQSKRARKQKTDRQSFEPTCLSAGFHAYTDLLTRNGQSTIERLRLFAMLYPCSAAVAYHVAANPNMGNCRKIAVTLKIPSKRVMPVFNNYLRAQ